MNWKNINVRKKTGIIFTAIHLLILGLVGLSFLTGNGSDQIGLFLPNVLLAFPAGILSVLIVIVLAKIGIHSTAIETITFVIFSTLYWYAIGYLIGMFFDRKKKSQEFNTK